MASINDAFPSNYLKASDLKGRSVVVAVDRIEFEPVGQKKEMKPVLYFAGKDKGLVLNKTNAAKIISLLGTDETDNWRGGRIQLYPTETSFQGDMVDCIRVKAAPQNGQRATPPPPPPTEDEMLEDPVPF
jgi:hypothetical protein